MLSDDKRAGTASSGTPDFFVVDVDNLNSLDETTHASAADTYQRAFAESPYNEEFTVDEAIAALASIRERNGNLLFGILEGNVVSIAGGYGKSEETYFIEELAVDPRYQG